MLNSEGKDILMKRIILLLLLTGATCSLVWGQVEMNPEGVQESIETFFMAMHEKDTALLKSMFGEELVFQSISMATDVSPQAIHQVDPVQFLLSIGQSGDMGLEERISNLSIHQDGPLAVAWMDYEFHLNGKRHHCGVNSFTLVYEDQAWKIVHLIDTRRPDCD